MVSRSIISRRRFLVGSAALATATIFPAVMPALAQSTDARVINAGGVRLRSGAGLRFRVLGSLGIGTAVRLLGSGGTVDGYAWSKIRIESSGTEGYVASQFLSPPSSGGLPIGTVIHVDTAGGGAANLRNGPGTGYGVVRTLANGTEGTIQSSPEYANGYTWYQVAIAGTGGWLATAVFATGPGTGRPRIEVADGPLRVRSSAGLGGSIIATVPTGATGEITSQMPQEANGYVWVNVRFFNQANTTGWVASDFLRWT